MNIDEFIEMFPALMSAILDQKGYEQKRRDVTNLAIALIGDGGTWGRTMEEKSNQAVDHALYLYERIEAGLRK